MSESSQLPSGWAWTTLGQVAEVNPRVDLTSVAEDAPVSFVRMAAVEEVSGGVDASQIRSLSEVRRGYTPFQDGDVLFAKITPCMENGKSAVVRNLRSGIGFGSTEFHVLRPSVGAEADFLRYFLSQQSYRDSARSSMTGTAGQLRLPASYLANTMFPLSPLAEQRRIVAAIEEQFTRLDAGVAALKRAQAALKRYRASVLKAAVEGKLTEQWRAEHADAQPAGELLAGILAERRARWEADQRAKGKDPAKAKYAEPQAPQTAGLPELPQGWVWATVEQLAAPEPNAITDGPFGSNLKTEHYQSEGMRVIRLQNIGDGAFNDARAYISPAHFSTLGKHQVFAGDIVIAALGEQPPRSCIIPLTLGPAIVKADCIRFKVSRRTLTTYAHWALNSDPTRKRTSSLIHGVGRPRLNLSEIKSIVLPLPSLAEQEAIVAEVERRLSVVGALEATIAANLKRAERLRQAILERAFTGRLVPQDPDDEPASALLERVRRERAASAAAGRGKGERVASAARAGLWEEA